MLKTRLNAFGLLFFTFYVTTVCFADGAVQTCGNPRLLTYQVVETISKVPRYTEGLIFLNGELVESAGDYGKSSISRLDSKTGKVIASTGLDAQYFAEGLTFFTGQFFQLTYREHQAFVYDSTQLGKIKTFSYEGEGWGLTSNDQNLIMSNGSSELNFLDPLTF
jgi:glutamine cyclotransferase